MTLLLVGVDFSTRSDRALRRAVFLARESNYELLLVGVIGKDASPETDGTRKSDAATILRRMARALSDDDGIRCRMEVRTGRPAEQLAKAAKDANADLMVIGPHRRGLIRDAFGSVTAERIVQHSQTPVIAANAPPSGPYRRVLLPIDFGDASRQAADTLRKLEFTDDKDIVFLNIYDPEAREMLGRAMVTQEAKRDYLSERAMMAKDELKDFAASVGFEHATLFVQETRGPMARDIEQFALEDGTDLIIVSRSHKGLIGRSILGSVTEDLLRAGKLDVLVVPSN